MLTGAGACDGRGAWAKHTFNEGTGKEVEVYLLDQRYEREVRTPKWQG